MSIFGRKAPTGLIPIHADNAANKDWLILLEANTIVGPSPERLRVAVATQEQRIVRKHNLLGRAKYFLEVKEYNPRIHIPFFCPQLYKYGPDKKLVPLQGDEIGRLIAHAYAGDIAGKPSWYAPSDKMPDPLTIRASALTEFDTVVVEMPAAQNAAAAG